jgi:hypothetical protein
MINRQNLLLTIAVSSGLLVLPALSYAHPAGCGVASATIFKSPKNWVEHTVAGITNVAFSSNQGFGITSGTLGCEDAGGPLASRVQTFLNKNLDQLAMDSATGTGETLAALVELIGIEEADQSLFKESVKSNFDAVFASTKSSSEDVYHALVDIMSHDVRLSKYLG